MIDNFPIINDLRDRTCYKCGREIKFGEFFLRNRTIPTKRLIKLWNDKNIEYYCCLCYDAYIKKLRIQNLKKSLKRSDMEVLEAIERRLGKTIPLIACIRYNSFGYTISNMRITGLGLFKMGLRDFPEEICYLDALKRLNLPWNYLESVPDSISQLKRLEYLDLIGNNIVHIPDTFGSLKRVREIDLSFNNLETVPASLSSLEHLEVLKLIRNKMKEIPSPLKRKEEKGLKILL